MKYKLTRDFMGWKKGSIFTKNEYIGFGLTKIFYDTFKELPEIFEPIKETPRWTKDGQWIDIREGEEAYYINGDMVCRPYMQHIDELKTGTIRLYISKKHAKKALEKQQADFAIKKRIAENDSDWEIDWNNRDQQKRFFYYSHKRKEYDLSCDFCTPILLPHYFSSDNKGKKFLAECKEHLDILFDIQG